MNAIVLDHHGDADRRILTSLMRMEVLRAEDVSAALDAANSSGRSVHDHLLRDRNVPRNDLLDASQKAGVTLTVNRIADLPEWDSLLNWPGQKLGGTEKDPHMAIVQLSTDRVARVFILVDVSHKDSRLAAASAVSKAQDAQLAVGALIRVSADVLAAVYAKWEATQAPATPSEAGETSDVQQTFKEMAIQAFRAGASDIHISCARGRADVHFRVHGELEHVRHMTPDSATEMVTALYNTLVERGSTKESFNAQQMQDGVIELALPEGMIRLRYSGLPVAPDGFDATLRIIPIGVNTKRKSMAELGYAPDQCEALERIFAHTSGLILFAGTTGSGKSTTMANQLRAIAEERPGKKIRTVEEPVEYRIEGVQQTPVIRLKGDSSDFLVALRQIMRSDPDVIGVGEIRDGDTATLAIQAVRSGHLCVSTIHADGAPVCYDRLIGMGINRLDLCQVGLVVGLIYQRLLPVLCTSCRVSLEDYRHTARGSAVGTINRLLGQYASDGDTSMLHNVYFRRPDGCSKCEGRGVVGRTVCAEILRPTSSMLAAIARGDSAKLWQLWRAKVNHNDPESTAGRTAFEHAQIKMLKGEVSPESVEAEFRYLDEPVFGDDHL